MTETEGANIKVMKQISIQELKARLSAAVAQAESGHTLVITRHNEPVATLGPVQTPAVHHGARVGMGGLTPAVRRGTEGRYLGVLLEDRSRR